jgi:hypothetical protein
MPLWRSWKDEDAVRLRQLRAAGVSAARAAIVLQKTAKSVKIKARQLGIPFESMRAQRKLRLEKQRSARAAAGLPPE